MTDERWPSVDRVLQAALDRPPQEREAFVRTACADDVALRDEVLSLLAHTASASGFLEAPSDERAQLSPGRRLGGYEVRERIGSGGMGDVYRATDAKLHRDIALKVLPAEASDADRRDRFAREARAIAALNHPGIVTIHSVEEDAGVHFLTMELVEGRTLAEAITPGGLPLSRLLDIAIPLADAVGAAHTRGIIHRDIKPANVMVTREGRIKVLDFGLAKLRTPDGYAVAPTTIEHGQPTREGSIVGTCAYMSPEQAEGRDVDHRSDVFSLGVLIYELATGVRPFKGDSTIAVLSSIVKDTPVPLATLRPDLPAALSRIVSRCLAKEPGRRYQSVLDLRNDLEELQVSPSAGPVPPSVGQLTRWRNTLLIAAAVILAGVAGYLLWSHTETAGGAFPQLLTIQPPSGVRIRQQEGWGKPILAISPDGAWVAFFGTGASERTGLYLHLTTELESRRISDESGGSPFFSPDSKWLGFWANDKLWKVRVAGGEPERICEVESELRGASWAEDNSIVYSWKRNLFRVSSEGGASEQLTHARVDDPQFFFPHVLPGSKAALVTLLEAEPVLAVVSLAGGEIIRRLLSGSSPQYVDIHGGWLVFRRSTRLYVAPFDLSPLNVTGDAHRVFDGVGFNPGGSNTSAFAVSRTGALLYVPPPERVEAAQLTWVNSHAVEEPVVPELLDYNSPTLDPSGTRIAVHIAKSGDGDLSVYDLRTKNWSRLTRGLATGRSIAWTEDGKWVVFSSQPFGIPRLFCVRADEREPQPKPLTGQDESGKRAYAYDAATSAHGNIALFYRQSGPSGFDLLKVQVDPPGSPTTYLKGDLRVSDGQISPNGQWIAYVSQKQAGSDSQVVVRSFPDSQAAQPLGVGPGTDPRWSADGRQLFFRRGRALLSVAFAASGLTTRIGEPQPVLTFPEDIDLASAYSVGQNGKFLVVKRSRPARTERLLVYVQNWMASARAAYAQSK